MAINNVRNVIVNSIEGESLSKFRKACATTDELFGLMEQATEPEEAYGMAVAFATSVLNLAELETRLLNSVLPQFESELDELVDQITPLIQRREDARAAVQEFRGPDHDVRPLSMKTDPNKARAVKKSKEHAKQVSIEVLGELRPIQADAEELQKDIGRIKLSLRALQVFVVNRFPIPTRKPMLRGQTAHPSGESPIEVFARKYADDLDGRDRVNAQAQAMQAARAHPTNRYDRSGQAVH